MILYDILAKSVWVPEGISCESEETANILRKLLSISVLDKHIPLCKPIGFKIVSNSSTAGSKSIVRDKYLGESNITLMNVVRDKILLEDVTNVICRLKPGVNKASETVFEVSIEKPGIPVLYTEDHIGTALSSNVTLHMQTATGTGLMQLEEVTKVIPMDYFPTYSEYTLRDYVRVLPVVKNNVVQIRYYNGMTLDIFRKLVFNFMNMHISKDIKEEEQQWMQNLEVRIKTV